MWFSHEEEWNSDTCYHMDEPCRHYTQWNKPDVTGQTRYDSPKHSHIHRRQTSNGGWRGLRGRNGELAAQWAQGFLLGWWQWLGPRMRSWFHSNVNIINVTKIVHFKMTDLMLHEFFFNKKEKSRERKEGGGYHDTGSSVWMVRGHTESEHSHRRICRREWKESW